MTTALSRAKEPQHAASMSPGRELWIYAPGIQPRVVTPRLAPYTLGRGALCDLRYPTLAGLSRKHLSLEARGSQWVVCDLGSANGTFVNGVRITTSHVLEPKDRVTAAELAIEFAEAYGSAANTVVFVDSQAPFAAAAAVATTLHDVFFDVKKLEGRGHVSALIRAGRELCGHLPLADLFELILDLSLDATGATRGALMTLESGTLALRAARGTVSISSFVRDRVVNDRQSLLVRDVHLEPPLSEHDSIVGAQIRSILAVPLQTESEVTGLIYVDTKQLVGQFDEDDLSLLTVLANVAATRIEHTRLAEVEQAKKLLAKDLEKAAEIQRRLLPRSAPILAGFDLAGYNIACHTVGGDYYDFITYPDGRVAMMIADVQGKGLPAALLMSSLKAWVQVLFEDCTGLATRVSRLSRLVYSSSDRLISFFVGVLDPATGELEYCNAGHNPPLVIRASGTTEKLEATGRMMGILPPAEYQCRTCVLKPRDLAVLYSDGVTEARQAGSAEEFQEEGLTRTLNACSSLSAAAMLERLVESLEEFSRGVLPADDVTIVIAKRTSNE